MGGLWGADTMCFLPRAGTAEAQPDEQARLQGMTGLGCPGWGALCLPETALL